MAKPYANRADIEVIVEHDEAAALSPPDPDWHEGIQESYARHEIVFAQSYARVPVHIVPEWNGGEVLHEVRSPVLSRIMLSDDCPGDYVHTPDDINIRSEDAKHLAEIAAAQTEELLSELERLGVELRA